MPVTLSSAVTVQPVPPSCGSSPPSPSSKWCCWAGKVNVHSSDFARFDREVDRLVAVVLEAAERLAVVDELLVGHLAPAEVPPPGRTRLALVVLEQPRRQQPAVALVGRGEQRVAEACRLVRRVVRLHRHLALGRRQERDRDAVLALPPRAGARAASRAARASRGSPRGCRRRCRRAAPGRGRRASARTRSPPRCPSRRRPARVKKNCSISFSPYDSTPARSPCRTTCSRSTSTSPRSSSSISSSRVACAPISRASVDGS